MIMSIDAEIFFGQIQSPFIKEKIAKSQHAKDTQALPPSDGDI